MATEKIVFETEVKTGNSATSVKSVKAELRELKTAMAGLDNSSQEFVKMAQRAGQLEDAIGDANAAVKAFNPEAKLKAVVDIVGVVANGFSAAQGAMALFGGESEELEKVMVKTQGAIALATGINGLMGMGDAFTNLSNIIKTKVVTAFGTMRSAIISTGILGLVVLIGTLIYSWMEEKKANEEATKELKRFGEENKRIQDEVTNTAIAGMKGRQKEQTELQRKFNDRIAELYKDETKTIREKNTIALELNKQLEIEQLALKDKYREEDLKRQKEKAEKEKELHDKNQKSNDEYAKLADEKFTKDMYAEIESLRTMNDLTSQFERKEFEDSQKRYDAEQKSINDAIELNRVKKEAQLNNLMVVGDALNGFIALAGQETATGKALAIAQATIDTYMGATSAYAAAAKIDPIVLAPLAAAGAIAAGLANVRRIVAVKVPGGGGGGSAPSGGGAPSVPQFNPAVAQQVQGGGDVQLGMKPQKVYVVESDIRGTMNKVDVIEANATIG
jgi:hypothetical protein